MSALSNSEDSRLSPGRNTGGIQDGCIGIGGVGTMVWVLWPSSVVRWTPVQSSDQYIRPLFESTVTLFGLLAPGCVAVGGTTVSVSRTVTVHPLGMGPSKQPTSAFRMLPSIPSLL